jgi:mRNA-degrading endonuclease toxin of MazEF toxin-antitoxin module
MTNCRRGDVVLVRFVFSEESGAKLRPALVVSANAYNRARQEAIVLAITSNVTRRSFGDHVIADWKEAGLLFPSLVTGIARTIKQAMVARKLGALSKRDLASTEREMHRSLDL